MDDLTVKTRIVLRNDTKTALEASAVVLLKGEVALELNDEKKTAKFKVGNGINTYAQLPYSTLTPDEIQEAISDAITEGGVTSVSLASGTTNGTVKLTVNGTTFDNIAVTGLKSAAFTESSDYATAAQGEKADAAMPKSGGAFTGTVTLADAPTTDLGAATKKYVDDQIAAKIAASDAMVYKGTIGTGGTVTVLPASDVVNGDTYKAISEVTIDENNKAKIGDLIIASVSDDTVTWDIIPSGDEIVTTVKIASTGVTVDETFQSGSIILGKAAAKQVATNVDSESDDLVTAKQVKDYIAGLDLSGTAENLAREAENLTSSIAQAAETAHQELQNSVNEINQNVDELSEQLDTEVNAVNNKVDDAVTTLNSVVNATETRVNNRIDNIITNSTSTESNSELIDIRTGTDGTVYDCAGQAVRQQIENITNYYHLNEIVPPLYYGTLNTGTGVISKSNSVSNRLVSDIIERKSFSKVVICNDNISVCVAYFQSTDMEDYVKSSIWLHGNLNNGSYEMEDYPYVAFSVKREDDGVFLTQKNGYCYLRQSDIIDRQIERITDNLSDTKNELGNNILDSMLTFLPTELQENNYIENDDCPDGNTLSINKRWFISQDLQKNDIISDISFYSTTYNTIDIEIWEKEGDTLTKAKTCTVATEQPGIYKVALNYAIKKSTYISIIQKRGSIPFQTCNSNYLMHSSDYSPETSTLSFSSLTNLSNFIPSINISCKTNISTTIIIGKGMRYENIQDALDNITDDSAQKPYTLLVMPSAVPYPRFSMIRKLNQSYTWNNVSPRYISIIGLNKKDCVIQSDNGEYDSPPAEMMTNGIIRNLTFRMTKNNPLSTPVKGGYAVHIDCRTLNDVGYKMTFEDCEFYSETGPAVGIGSHTNTDLTFSGCRFESTSSLNYQPNENYFNLTSYGCIFAHTSKLADASNQKLTLKNCVGICKEGVKSLWVATAGSFSPQTGDYLLTLLNNVFWNSSTSTSAYSINSQINLNPINFNNNNQ